MSYNTDLQTNNVNLQAILDTVNNLPEAGGGGVSGPSIVTGTFTPTGTAGSVSVTGLGFRPKSVIVVLNKDSGSSNASGRCVLVYGENINGVVKMIHTYVYFTSSTSARSTAVYVYGTNITTNSSQQYYSITLDEDGFTITNESSNTNQSLPRSEYIYTAHQ